MDAPAAASPLPELGSIRNQVWRPDCSDALRVARQLLEEDPLGLAAEVRALLLDGGLAHDPRELFERACAIAAVESLLTPGATVLRLRKRALAGALGQLEGAAGGDGLRRLHRAPLPERLALLALVDGAGDSRSLALRLHARRGLARLGASPSRTTPRTCSPA